MARRGDDARTALVEHAERLFAERGIEGVSLRDVSAAAGQRNHSAAQYHFGDREGLVAAVYNARMHLINVARHDRLAQIDADNRADDVVALVEAIVIPLVDLITESHGWYGRFLARTRWDRYAWGVLLDVPAAASYRATVVRLDRLLGHLPADVRRSRLDQLLTLVVGTVAGWEWAHDRDQPRLSPNMLTAELVSTGVALATATVLTSTR
ncbi:MAG: TetR family transcriptional regulator [Ilumatobacteraceae bacterium]